LDIRSLVVAISILADGVDEVRLGGRLRFRRRDHAGALSAVATARSGVWRKKNFRKLKQRAVRSAGGAGDLDFNQSGRSRKRELSADAQDSETAR